MEIKIKSFKFDIHNESYNKKYECEVKQIAYSEFKPLKDFRLTLSIELKPKDIIIKPTIAYYDFGETPDINKIEERLKNVINSFIFACGGNGSDCSISQTLDFRKEHDKYNK